MDLPCMPENKPDMTRSHHTRDAHPASEAQSDLEQQVQILTRELEQSNKELESLSYAVSHDLRAPLRSINGFSEALLEDYSDQLDETARDYLQRVTGAARHMSELIDAMLVLSRVTRKEIRQTDVDLSAAARHIAGKLREQDPSRTVEWNIHEGLHGEGDAELLHIVLENLLGNAWKYTGKNTGETCIEFAAAEQGGRTVYFVHDNGCGFNTRYADKLFTAFQRLHGKEYEGAGIGLAIVHRIIQRHQGRVWAESVPGEGSTFYFTFN
jgi:light-regulated signal transduction histidine kinase (bacteriophytochrome)